MARTRYNSAIEELHGATSPGRIHRQKRFRDAYGRIIGAATPETYDVTHPRNWEQKRVNVTHVSMRSSVPSFVMN